MKAGKLETIADRFRRVIGFICDIGLTLSRNSSDVCKNYFAPAGGLEGDGSGFR
jgi:hypothetical protein